MMVCMGRLRAPNVFGCSGSTTKQAPRLVSMIPVRSVQIPTPKVENSVLIRDTAMRSRSTTASRPFRCRVMARSEPRFPPAGVDPLRECTGETLVDERRHRHPHTDRVGDVGIANRIGEARGLEREMQSFGAESIESREIEPLQDVEQHQRGQPLGIGWQLQNVEAAIVGGDGCDHLAPMISKVAGGEQ